ILTTRVVSVTGTPTTADASSTSVQLLRPVEALNSEPTVSMIVDLAFDPAFIHEPLIFLSRHGGIGGSGIRIFYYNDQEEVLLSEIDHYFADQNNPGYNDTSFEIDLTPLDKIPPANSQLMRIAPPKMLWAFYYPWIAWDQDASCTDHPSIPYDYNDDGVRTSETFAKQIEQAQSAGIDGFIVSWVDDETLNQNLSLLLDAAQEKGFFIAIYLESTPDPNDRTVHPEIITDWLAYAIPEFGDHPAYMQLNGKPLIVVYNSSAAPLETWQTIFADLDTRGDFASYIGMSYTLTDLSLFDGLHQYAIIGIPDLLSVYQSVSRGVRYYSLLSDTEQQKIFVATVQPGFDDCPYHPPTTDLLMERNNGDYYRSTFEAAIQSNPDWIIITSWNEFGETTHIEPSDFFGTQYLEITREFAERWKSP
ncbi:MAG: endo-1,3-alpha-glucanase family glycosylhydrolase, partial [Chloroflexota bacterium]